MNQIVRCLSNWLLLLDLFRKMINGYCSLRVNTRFTLMQRYIDHFVGNIEKMEAMMSFFNISDEETPMNGA